jgi:hypothetical protein
MKNPEILRKFGKHLCPSPQLFHVEQSIAARFAGATPIFARLGLRSTAARNNVATGARFVPRGTIVMADTCDQNRRGSKRDILCKFSYAYP